MTEEQEQRKRETIERVERESGSLVQQEPGHETAPPGAYEEPREAVDPSHRDAGQVLSDHANERELERQKAQEGRTSAKQEKSDRPTTNA